MPEEVQTQEPPVIESQEQAEATEAEPAPKPKERVPLAVVAIQQMRRHLSQGLDDLDYLILRAKKGAKFDRADMLRAFAGSRQAIVGLAGACEMALRDLFGAANVLSSLEGGLYQQAATLSSVIEVLKNKGVLTDEDVSQAWENVVKARYEEAASARDEQIKKLAAESEERRKATESAQE